MKRLFVQGSAALLFGACLAIVQPISAADNSGPYAAPPPPSKTKKADEPKKDEAAEAAAPAAGAGDLTEPMPPRDRVAKSPKGTMKNPYTDNPDAIAEGKKIYFKKSCNGCHGGTGGGGMCPPLSNVIWVYGDDDDTLFRLITLGSDDLMKEGYVRKGSENVVGPMPPFGDLIDTDQELWKMLAWIRTTFNGGEDRRNW